MEMKEILKELEELYRLQLSIEKKIAEKREELMEVINKLNL